MILQKSAFASLLLLVLTISAPAGADEFSEINTSQAQSGQAEAESAKEKPVKQGYDLIKNDINKMEQVYQQIREGRIEKYGENSEEVRRMGETMEDHMPRAYEMMKRADRASNLGLEGIFKIATSIVMYVGAIIFVLIGISKSFALIVSPDATEKREGMKILLLSIASGVGLILLSWVLINATLGAMEAVDHLFGV